MSPTQRSLTELRKCEHCGFAFKPKRKSHRTCSRTCGVQIRGGKRKITSLLVPCNQCGTKFKIGAHRHANTKNHFCSRLCYGDWKSKHATGRLNTNFRDAGHRKCEGCGNSYHSYNKQRRFCGVQCSQELASSLGLSNVCRGNEAELICGQMLNWLGYHVMRSKASRGTFDLWAVGCGEVLFVQVKRTRDYSRRFAPKYIREITGSLCYRQTPLVRKQLWSFVDEGPRMGWYILDL